MTKMRGCVMLLLASLMFPALAQADDIVVESGDMGNTGCKVLTRHVPDADVTYHSSVEADADSAVTTENTPPIAVPDGFWLELDPLQRVGVPVGQGVSGKMVIGDVTVAPDNSVRLNDTLISSGDAVACDDAHDDKSDGEK